MESKVKFTFSGCDPHVAPSPTNGYQVLKIWVLLY